jgi:hypothetical protein
MDHGSGKEAYFNRKMHSSLLLTVPHSLTYVQLNLPETSHEMLFSPSQNSTIVSPLRFPLISHLPCQFISICITIHTSSTSTCTHIGSIRPVPNERWERNHVRKRDSCCPASPSEVFVSIDPHVYLLLASNLLGEKVRVYYCI